MDKARWTSISCPSGREGVKAGFPDVGPHEWKHYDQIAELRLPYKSKL